MEDKQGYEIITLISMKESAFQSTVFCWFVNLMLHLNTVGLPGKQEPEQRRASEESPAQGWILMAPAGFNGDLKRTDDTAVIIEIILHFISDTVHCSPNL